MNPSVPLSLRVARGEGFCVRCAVRVLATGVATLGERGICIALFGYFVVRCHSDVGGCDESRENGGVQAGGEEHPGAQAVLHPQLSDLWWRRRVLRLRPLGLPGRDQRAQPVAPALRHGGGHVGDSVPLRHARGCAQGVRPCRQVHGSHGQG